ncbi:MAG: stage III sporulation protein AD [Clostridia bacterium]|nr:stage III sporulation protein AD [Clostridia bacterium]
MSEDKLLVAAVGILLCGALLALMLRTRRPDLAMCLSLAAGGVVLILLLGQLAPLLVALRRMGQTGGLEDSHLAVVLKGAGVCLLTQLTADTCRDAGEAALAGKAELTGRILLLLLAVPLFEELLTLVLTLINRQAVGG